MSGRAKAWALLLSMALSMPGLGVGCGQAETGDMVEDVPGQDEGEQRSMEEMERLMQEGMVE